MTYLIIANVETLSHDDGYSYSFSSDGHQFGGHGPFAPSGSATGISNTGIRPSCCSCSSTSFTGNYW